MVVSVFVLVVGGITHRGVKDLTLESLMKDQLSAVLSSDVLALDLWIEERKNDAVDIADDMRVRRLTQRLVEGSFQDSSRAKESS